MRCCGLCCGLVLLKNDFFVNGVLSVILFQYLLSFPVIGENGEERVDYMKNHLAEMRESNVSERNHKAFALLSPQFMLLVFLSAINSKSEMEL